MTHTHRHHRLSALGGTLGGLPSLKCLHPWQNNTIHRWSHTGCCGGRSTVGHTSLRRMVLTWRACTTLFWNLNSSLLSPKEPDRQNFTNALKSEPSGRKKASRDRGRCISFALVTLAASPVRISYTGTLRPLKLSVRTLYRWFLHQRHHRDYEKSLH